MVQRDFYKNAIPGCHHLPKPQKGAEMCNLEIAAIKYLKAFSSIAAIAMLLGARIITFHLFTFYVPAIAAFDQPRINQSHVKMKVGFWQSSDKYPGGSTLGGQRALQLLCNLCGGGGIVSNSGRGLGGRPAPHLYCNIWEGLGGTGDTTFGRWH